MPVLRGLVALSLLATMAFIVISCGDDEPEPVGPTGPQTSAAQPAAAQPGSGAAVVAVTEFTVVSDAFSEGGQIPQKYTCDGEDLSPDLRWNTPPDGTRSIVIVADDPDAPGGTFFHWTVINLPVDIRALAERVGNATTLPEGAVHGQNGFGNNGYGGPCPPQGSEHEYRFWVYALSEPLSLTEGAASEDVITSLQGKVLATGKLTGTYRRP